MGVQRDDISLAEGETEGDSVPLSSKSGQRSESGRPICNCQSRLDRYTNLCPYIKDTTKNTYIYISICLISLLYHLNRQPDPAVCFYFRKRNLKICL